MMPSEFSTVCVAVAVASNLLLDSPSVIVIRSLNVTVPSNVLELVTVSELLIAILAAETVLTDSEVPTIAPVLPVNEIVGDPATGRVRVLNAPILPLIWPPVAAETSMFPDAVLMPRLVSKVSTSPLRDWKFAFMDSLDPEKESVPSNSVITILMFCWFYVSLYISTQRSRHISNKVNKYDQFSYLKDYSYLCYIKLPAMRTFVFGRKNPNPDNELRVAIPSTDNKIPIRIDKKTIIFANDDADAERIRTRYNVVKR